MASSYLVESKNYFVVPKNVSKNLNEKNKITRAWIWLTSTTADRSIHVLLTFAPGLFTQMCSYINTYSFQIYHIHTFKVFAVYVTQ